MTVQFKNKTPAAAIAITVVDRAAFQALSASLPAPTRQWLATVGFSGAPDTQALVPGPDGKLAQVFAGVSGANAPFALAHLPLALPAGSYWLDASAGLSVDAEAAALSWELGGYQFDLYKKAKREPATLVMADSPEAQRGLALATAITATRDLVNTPAEHMGPEELAKAAQLLAKQHGAKFSQIVGDALLKKNFPAVHAVGRAAARAPRLIELNWGNPKHPRIAIVGKGVCFDTGGLNIKGGEGMRQMKKDMGGAANALGLATLIMALKLPVRLQLLIPAVENAISGNAYRPGDIVPTRKGLNIEIGNTDAEGRVVLSDALAYASEGKPELIIDLATLTGAARVALGAQLPALFSKHFDTARDLVDLGLKLDDPLWHMPLWAPYKGGIESTIGDIVNTGKSALAGAINAALFLEYFVPENQDWLHIDLFAWNDGARPGRPVGGEAQTIRTLLAYLEQRFTA
ncbi:MAG: leucyl aminopeptidase family protein [Roseateles asaccharophilus]|uniref:Leucyl aminopeptidase n=1 Tax=Roseateles asaccharophilus TaxID=582607 RepID=A0A4R6NAQ1_9BURK|nr:leucyl aminopeptidase family protein [Roseateles asaccharophilus]MDN3543270.1 leucyl aminopeptidase family protein [Roseateles asaccharophilus]TDP13032.1 leucyl aminopeptidase [Roseateles asaccharophilus]